MTKAREKHLKKIVARTKQRMSDKYRKGAAEHREQLWDLTPKTLVAYSIDEAIDQLVYLLTLQESLEMI